MNNSHIAVIFKYKILFNNIFLKNLSFNLYFMCCSFECIKTKNDADYKVYTVSY